MGGSNEPEHVLVLPPLTPDIRDKILILKIRKMPMPMPTHTPELEKIFWDNLSANPPTYLREI
jgi:hypothetical protein